MRFLMLAALVFAAPACGGQSPPPPAPAEDGDAWDRLAEGPLRDPHVRLPQLAPLATLGRDGMRVTIAPSFGTYSFAVDFVPQPFNCFIPPADYQFPEAERGRLCRYVEVRYSIAGRAPRAIQMRRFVFRVPEEEYRAAIEEFDERARHWRGSPGPGTDGTDVAVEQYRDGRLRSMRTNSSVDYFPNNPALQVLPYVHRMLLAYGPAGAVPVSDSFTVEDGAADPCLPSGFNSPDPDGFGTGEDPCARATAASRRPAR
jgi:hypothetical protein